MKVHFLLVGSAFLLLGMLSFRFIADHQNNPVVLPDNRTFIGCALPARLDLRPDASGKYAPVFPGWGTYSYPVHTSSDSARLFFNQGLNMYYSYHLTEALASFKEAARHDASCAMAYWGQALSMGPYYNSYVYKMPAAVLPVLAQMNQAAANSTEKEKDLVDAINKRYSTDTADGKRSGLNRAYAVALAALVKKYPADADIKALYVDAVMLEHTWDFWNNDGTPKAWTMELVKDCDEILKAHPEHPAALHYQIHLVEASLHPEKALHNADVLKAAMPGVSHMVHMASHMYQRNGLYAKGVDVNQAAGALQTEYDGMAPNLKLGVFSLTHFNAVGSFCAMNANMYKKGSEMAGQLHDILAKDYRARLSNTFFQYLYMLPMFAAIRSGKWETVAAMPEPGADLHYAVLLDHFGKGLAFIKLHDTAAAGRHLQGLKGLLKDSSLPVRNLPFNAALDCAKIAAAILEAELLAAQGKINAAKQLLKTAVVYEDQLIYREPKDWPIPARHFLGAYLLKMKQASAAEKVYRQDLALNPGNGWSLLGLYQSLMMQHKTAAARKYQAAFKLAFANADELPPASVYN